MVKSILMVGVGGQGIVLASNIATAVFLELGYDAKKSEIHGMAQRGGSVVSHIRYSDEAVLSPVIPFNEADIIISFEQMEFLRYLDYVNDKTVLIVNKRKISPPAVATGVDAYPQSVVDEKKKLFAKVYEIDADATAVEAGSSKVASIPLLAKLAVALENPKNAWIKVISEYVPKKTVDINRKAFELIYK